MKKFLKHFANEYAEKHLNRGLGSREYEPPLYEFILDVFYSIENTGYLTLTEWEHITDESKIDPWKYIVTRKRKSSSKKNNEQYININYSRCTLLKMKFRGEVKGDVDYKTVSLLVPKFDDDNFMTLNSKLTYLLYQMVDNSTYVTKNSVVLKGLMPLCVNRQSVEITDTDNTVHRLPMYRILNFKKEFNPLILYAAKFGYSVTIHMMGVAPVLRVFDIDEPEMEGWTYFIIKNTLTTGRVKDSAIKIGVVTKLFKKYTFLQSMVAMVHDLLTIADKPTKEKIDEHTFWLDELGYLYTKDRNTSRDIGRSTLVFWERLADKTNKRILKMYKCNKASVYDLTRVLLQNFDAFKNKDNSDINNKRLRRNEYIGSLLSIRMGKSVNRILSKGDKVTLDDVMGILKVPPNQIVRMLGNSQLIKYNDIVNDMNFFDGYKYTVKGPNAVGKTNERKVTARDRAVPMSSIGKIDPDVCSSSSPGRGGLVSPFAKTMGLYFSDEMEPQDGAFELIKETENYMAPVHVKIPDTYAEYVEDMCNGVREVNHAMKVNLHGDRIYLRISEDSDW